MILTLVFCGVFALAIAAPAPAPRKCVPEQYEGIVLGKVAQVVNQTPMALSLSACFASDYKNQKEAFHEVVTFNEKPVKISVIADYRKMIAFYIQHDQKKCTSVKIPYPQERFCSDMSKPTSSFMMGDEMVDVYDIERVYLGQKSLFSVTMFRESFTPVTEIIKQTFTGIPQMVALQYGNVTLGIKDETIFDIPSFC